MRYLLLPAVFGILFIFETFYQKRRLLAPRRQRFYFHFLISFLNTLYTRLTCWALLLFWVLMVDREGWGLRFMFGLQGIAEILATIVVADFFEYLWHRLNHRIPFLWRFHRVHHTDRDVDVSTALRFHPLELTFSYGFKAVWIFLWGPSIEAFLWAQALITLYSLFHHSNIDLSDSAEKWAHKIHMTPRLHTAHHTVSPRTRNANYAVIFIFWDRLLGTYRDADAEESKFLGVPHQSPESLSFKRFYLEPFHVVQKELA